MCQDLFEQGAESVTMVQRSPSLVLSQDCVLTLGLGPAGYSEDALERGCTAEDAGSPFSHWVRPQCNHIQTRAKINPYMTFVDCLISQHSYKSSHRNIV